VPRQIAASGLNAVLVAPQFAIDALDSSSGNFWTPGVFAKYVDEAGERLARLHGDARARDVLARAPVVLAAYSGGYNPAAFALAVGGANARIRGVLLLDALYAEHDKFADWLAQRPNAFFFSAYGKASRSDHAELQRLLVARGVGHQKTVPARLNPGTIALYDVGDEVVHNDFVTKSWVNDPLAAMLARIPGFARTGGGPKK
jgi:hypothetical protein